MNAPLVSIVTPLHNAGAFISETIQSVQNQTYRDWEMIIVDDGSTDNSIDIVQSFIAEDPRIRLIPLYINAGAAVARNKAIEEARGRYIAFLDSDDRWFPVKLERQLAFMQAYDHPFTYAAYEKTDESGQRLESIGVPAKVRYKDLLKVCSIGCLTAMYDTHYFGKIYMPLIRKRQDLGLWLRLLKMTEYAHGLDEILAQYRVRTDSISSNKMSAAKFTWRLYRDIEVLNPIKASYYFAHYAARGFLRTKTPKIARFLGVLK